jgi:hypothetical protein
VIAARHVRAAERIEARPDAGGEERP